ncbi:cobalt ECF transporter T component CbiQ [Clostridium sediminicola]|uniref:cobalt ECF transporter T component CbiQ n=1 Tax=Clostridium sediminicola TaxID=3114879 RepID=UPI0031F26C76
MSNIIYSIFNMRYLDELASRESNIHNINPVIKLIVTLIYLVIVLSFEKYDILPLIPYIFYLIIIFTLSETPFFQILKRSLIVFPIVIGIGIFNPMFDTETYGVILGVGVSGGWISLISLLIKSCLIVLAGFLLIATTGIEKIAYAFRRLCFPKIFVTQILLTYRYISVLLDETARVLKAYHLRAPMEKGISFKVSGSLLGQMLLRAFDRANRVYSAMILRGFNGEYVFGREISMSIGSLLYLFLWVAYFIVARVYNIPEALGNVIMGVL